MDLSTLQELLNRLAATRVVTVGDLMVDRFVYGEVSRVSAEAPVPVFARGRESVMLGAAGNVARNIAALGGEASLIGIVGKDAAALEAMTLVGAEDRVEGFLLTDPGRATTVKTRFVAAGQQMLRVDLEDTAPVTGEIEKRLVRTIRDTAVGAAAILVSDYGKGVASPMVIEACLETARREAIPLIVDSKSSGFAQYGAADLIKPNAAELSRATDLPTETDNEIEAALSKAMAQCLARSILVTRAAKGMSLAVRGGDIRHFQQESAEVFDTSGAGDTALAAVGLTIAAGAAFPEAIELALLASRVAVTKRGTATVTPDELVEASLVAGQAASDAKIATPGRAVREATRWRECGLRIGFTNGCFDILHPGHIAYLKQARAWCDRLIVGINTDASVARLKGAGRPINPLESRALVLAGLSCVDLVAAFEDDTPEALIRAIRPDLLVKGGDYTPETVVGRDIVESWGGEVRIAALVEGHSTTATISRLTRRA